ncbi:hypothetical protein J3F83DRAFT_397446 [Trichoderma novae-zelandiae]
MGTETQTRNTAENVSISSQKANENYRWVSSRFAFWSWTSEPRPEQVKPRHRRVKGKTPCREKRIGKQAPLYEKRKRKKLCTKRGKSAVPSQRLGFRTGTWPSCKSWGKGKLKSGDQNKHVVRCVLHESDNRGKIAEGLGLPRATLTLPPLVRPRVSMLTCQFVSRVLLSYNFNLRQDKKQSRTDRTCARKHKRNGKSSAWASFGETQLLRQQSCVNNFPSNYVRRGSAGTGHAPHREYELRRQKRQTVEDVFFPAKGGVSEGREMSKVVGRTTPRAPPKRAI